ncbi:MAG: PDZ domain-containing protein [Clostridiaceae bacterium]|nr:PDZ domain-containing protein [Clostridiaceae bacterium]
MIREEIKQAKPRHRFLRGLALVLVGIILATTGTYILQSTGILGERNKVQNVETQTVKQEPRQLNISIKEDGTVENAVAAKAIPSIVGITALVRGESQMNPFFFYNEVPKYKEGVGSGVIVDPEGYILTNSHVVNNDEAEKLTVSFADSEKAEAELVWHDQTLDLAVIKVDKTNLPAVELGDSDEVQVGDKAIAVGNPLGLDLQSTLTSGYISGLNRTIQVQDGQSINILDGLMQTDAAINSGNSGGALLNVNGEVIGINTARPQTADGIGFAIPINVAKPIIAEIKEHGSYESVYFGISGVNMQMVTIMNSEEELPTETGVLVDQVMDNSPAEKAGLESGDIIYAIDEQPVDSFNSLKTQLLKYKTGDKAEVSIYRGQKEMTLEIEFTNFSFDSIVG